MIWRFHTFAISVSLIDIFRKYHLQLDFDIDSTPYSTTIRLRYDHSTTYVTTVGLLEWVAALRRK